MTLPYCCPRCKHPVQERDEAYRCDACDATYPVVLGIPDFRIYADPYIAIEDDYEKAGRIADAGDFKAMIERYWSITSDTPPAMAKRFIEHSLAGEERGRHLIGLVPDAGKECAIELGCRTGGVVVALAERFGHAVGIDVAFRWLVVARKRMEEAGQDAQIVCCCADALPFASGSFDLMLAENVLEHTAAQQELVDEAHRALKPGGAFLSTTWNRLSPAREPHVKLFGVGWLPRGLAKRYVRRFRGVDYDHVRLISWRGLRRLVRRSPFTHARLRAHAFSEAELRKVSPFAQRLLRIYHGVRGWPVFRQILLLIAPVLELSVTSAAASQEAVPPRSGYPAP